jgi:hypothetical protein
LAEASTQVSSTQVSRRSAAFRAAVILSIPPNGRHRCRPGTRGRALMKKLLLTVIVSAAGFAVWRKVEAGKAGSKAGTQPWATATDKV